MQRGSVRTEPSPQVSGGQTYVFSSPPESRGVPATQQNRRNQVRLMSIHDAVLLALFKACRYSLPSVCFHYRSSVRETDWSTNLVLQMRGQAPKVSTLPGTTQGPRARTHGAGSVPSLGLSQAKVLYAHFRQTRKAGSWVWRVPKLLDFMVIRVV